ncbi:hypothetical protein TNCT_221591 [Trichonephila clavata]|uniref:Uncharacterized protein n=1 Tax=Trichonephila clavata TaxID=2740835 RepID=A0A8X6L157_TRICU|nr:hypothetical protein TNCT_221591 [Trichonephila clavata]
MTFGKPKKLSVTKLVFAFPSFITILLSKRHYEKFLRGAPSFFPPLLSSPLQRRLVTSRKIIPRKPSAFHLFPLPDYLFINESPTEIFRNCPEVEEIADANKLSEQGMPNCISSPMFFQRRYERSQFIIT